MSGKSSLEIKVGIFAFIALVILIMAVFSISEIYIFRAGYDIEVCFGFASGLDTGASVRVAGIEVGEVKSITLSYDRNKGKAKVVAGVWLKDGVRIPRDSAAYVSILGLIGETYLEIIPGQDYKHALRGGDVLWGRDPLSTENLMEVFHKVGNDFGNMLNSVNEVMDDKLKEDLKETVSNFREISQSLKVITARLERGEGKLGRWLKPKKKKR